MFLCHLPVFLNTHEVDQGCAPGHGEDVDEGWEPIEVQDDDNEGTESLQDPIKQVELYSDQISVSSLHSSRITKTTHIHVLLLAEPNKPIKTNNFDPKFFTWKFSSIQ